MNEVMSQSRLYRKLVPSKAKLVTSAAISILLRNLLPKVWV